MFGCLGLLHLILPPLTPSSRLPRAAAFLALLLAASLPQLPNGRAPGVNYEGRPSSGRPWPDAAPSTAAHISALQFLSTSALPHCTKLFNTLQKSLGILRKRIA